MSESILKQERIKFQIQKESLFIKIAVILMAVSAGLRLIGCWGLWDNAFYTTTQIVLPICCNALFILSLLLSGKKYFALSSIPVILGAVFFIIKATEFVWWKMLISIIAYLATAFLYSATAFGIVKTKWPLVPVFGIPLIVHLVYDFGRLGDTVNPVTLSDGLQEISVICILLAMLCTAVAIKKPKTELENSGLPKIKGPKFIKAGKKTEQEPEDDIKKTEEEAKPQSENSENPDEKEKSRETEAGE